MKPFEKCLKTILTVYSADRIPLYSPNYPNIKESDLKFLAALELIFLDTDDDDTFYIVPSNKGVTYFHRQKEERRRFWKEHIVNFVGGFISGVFTAVLAAAAVQILL